MTATTMLLQTVGAMALTTTLGVQAPTPSTQPVRPPDRPPAGEPATPLPAPEPDLGDARSRGVRGTSSPEGGDVEAGTLVLTGCLQRVSARTYQLRPVEGDDATITEEVQLGGGVERLRQHVGQVVELRGTYEQGTPASAPATFSVDRVRPLGRVCPASSVRPPAAR